MRRNMRLGGFAVAILMALATMTQAGMVDLSTAGSSGTINGAIFLQADIAPSGSGVLESFVRIKGKDIEEGYNTSWRPVAYDENTSPTFTHSLLLSDIPFLQLTPGGVFYYEFILDINQSKAEGSSLLSLDDLRIFQESSGDLHYTSGPLADKAYLLADLGDPIYDMGGPDNWVKMDYELEPGSGNADVFVYLPKDLFDADIPYVYLYSKFGVSLANNDGYEEWAVRGDVTGPPVPVPGAVLLGMLGMSVAGWRLRRFA